MFHSIDVEPDGEILVAAIHEDAVFRVDPSTGDRVEISSPAVGSGPTFTPIFVTLGANVNEIFVTTGTKEIFRIDATTGDRTLVSWRH